MVGLRNIKKKIEVNVFEIVFDFRFEKNLNNVPAQYSLNEKGNVIVLNSGYNFIEKEWKKADGLAKFRGNKDIATLKVSFFWSFLLWLQCDSIR